MGLEVVLLAVFQYEQASFFQQVVFEDEVGKGFQAGQFIGWVGKDEVELLAASLNVFEHIATYGKAAVGL